MNDVLVYTTDPCSFCSRVKQLLQARGIEYTEVNLARDPAGRAELVERTGMMSFPQVVIGGEVLGGFQETLRADQTGRLRELLAAA
ncbi:MAG TPA: glutaredoxin domain-containing protein [Solirubrobacteraceae bacterium]|jgi:glutaredoxin 3|nr:glutaredoxin domain-containing protein [Solirubrobacteraceae bacterium]